MVVLSFSLLLSTKLMSKKKKKKTQKKQIKQTTIGLMDSLKFHTYHLSNLLVLHYINKKYIYIYVP